MAEAATPHDAVFRTFLSRVETARDFIEIHLPPSLIQICKLDTLRLESGSFIEDDLRPYYSDILYSLETTSGQGYVHVLIEHQSSPDKLMAFRLMRYAIAAMQRHLDTLLSGTAKPLPLVPELAGKLCRSGYCASALRQCLSAGGYHRYPR
ncbi:hypothetical protein SB6411_00721 [Klebsiella spallanzanii]|uniref:Transposase (putative) YhgA-like domain-containing protein n=1 Tax=Klebsiella spallanzanii TaxID=2587528 RepID=A0ABY6VAI9_9ENTR|nr:hypothetical protein SB6411_00721 [Klebsiella spallanzanii]